MKNIVAIVLGLIVVVAGYLGWQYYQKVQLAVSGPAKEIVSESIEKNGDVWHANFVSKLAFPVADVYEAFTHPERLAEFAPDDYRKAEVVKEEGNTKVVDIIAKLDILPPGFKIQNPRIKLTFFPAEKRVETETIDFQLADIKSVYTFEAADGGTATVVRLDQTNKSKTAAIVEALQKGAIRQSYLNQIRAAIKGLEAEAKPATPQAQAG